eukprot:scaffold663086_cov73-Prasinocladus_malaysianus.AAC.1
MYDVLLVSGPGVPRGPGQLGALHDSHVVSAPALAMASCCALHCPAGTHGCRCGRCDPSHSRSARAAVCPVGRRVAVQ